MKKIFFIIITMILHIFVYTEDIKETNCIVLSYGMDINKVKDVLGEPLEHRLIQEYVESEFNEYLLRYEGLSLYYEIGDKSISYILSSSPQYALKIDDTIVSCGETKMEVEKKFGTLYFDYSYNNTDVYCYYADNFLIAFFAFNKDEKLVTVQYEHE